MKYKWGKQMNNQVHPFEPAFVYAVETFCLCRKQRAIDTGAARPPRLFQEQLSKDAWQLSLKGLDAGSMSSISLLCFISHVEANAGCSCISFRFLLAVLIEAFAVCILLIFFRILCRMVFVIRVV